MGRGFDKGANPCAACVKVVNIGHCFDGNWLAKRDPDCTCTCRGCTCDFQVSNGIGGMIVCDYCKAMGYE